MVRLALAAACALALAMPASALGQVNLTGETFLDFPASDEAVSPTPTIEGNCDRNGVTTFTIRSEGTAVGPYPGTYTETAVARIGPQVLAPIPDAGPFQGSFGFNVGPLLSFEARFQIDAVDPVTNGPATVTGRKELSTTRAPLPAPPSTGVTDPGNNGMCAELENERPPPTPLFSPDTPPLTGFWRTVDASTLEYTAIIRTPNGVFRDVGGARASARNAYAEFSSVPGSNAGRVDQFVEIFNSDFTELPSITREDCRDDAVGAIFRNRGDCVSFVATDGRNEPGQNVPRVP